MELHLLDIAVIVLYLIVMIVAGSYMSRKASVDLDSYFL